MKQEQGRKKNFRRSARTSQIREGRWRGRGPDEPARPEDQQQASQTDLQRL